MGKVVGILMLLVISQLSISQDLERKYLYYGNKAYDEKLYDEAIGYYEEALQVAPLSFKTNFNMANAYFKKGDFQKAIDIYSSILDLAPTAYDRSKVYHNLGNSHFMNQKLNEAIEAYKEALKINPLDEDSRYNLAYALLLKQQQQQQNPEQNENNENSENNNENSENQNSENENSSNQDSNENSDGDGEQDQNESQNDNNSDGNQGNDKTDKEKATQQNRISKEQARRILDAALKKEKEVQKKMEQYKKVGTGESSKKDW